MCNKQDVNQLAIQCPPMVQTAFCKDKLLQSNCLRQIHTFSLIVSGIQNITITVNGKNTAKDIMTNHFGCADTHQVTNICQYAHSVLTDSALPCKFQSHESTTGIICCPTFQQPVHIHQHMQAHTHKHTNTFNGLKLKRLEEKNKNKDIISVLCLSLLIQDTAGFFILWHPQQTVIKLYQITWA